MQTKIHNMGEYYLRDASATLPDKVVELNDKDAAMIKKIMFNGQHRAQDRVWLEPLLAQMDA